MDNENKHVDESRCPLCGCVNQCSVESGDCWCFHTTVPQELQDRVPAELRGRVCICRICVEEFKANRV
ncbi:cysteine-rich CWC family protein [Paenibacillus baekrokdamisoli]|uniref:cysteine-rich CWC family protein n=1 Tax=Paenibacillus baekrokdamisoli TaxID=1712516 RepID=UPI000F7892F3|nr:cysteine-rich CWC family protein [Paenibacillus baekrokdamisoli]